MRLSSSRPSSTFLSGAVLGFLLGILKAGLTRAPRPCLGRTRNAQKWRRSPPGAALVLSLFEPLPHPARRRLFFIKSVMMC